VLHLIQFTKLIMLPFTIHLQDGEPISDQIVRAARCAVANGEVRAGDLFPSVRQLAQDLKVSPTTAHKVVLQLKERGLLVSRPGVGMVVARPQVPSLETRQELITPACERLLKEASDLNLSIEEAIEALRKAADSSN